MANHSSMSFGKGLENCADDRPAICHSWRVNRYMRDFDREAEADGMLIKLNERRKKAQTSVLSRKFVA